MKRLHDIDNKWFFSRTSPLSKILLIFVKGDYLVLLPLIAVVLLTYLISLKFMVCMIGVYVAVRYLGEMIYWFAHQFYKREYRPYDFGFKKLDTHAIYILYQTFSVAGTVAGIGILLYALLYL